MKLEANRRPKLTAIDISKEPYDHLLSNLKYWKIKDNETIISTLNSLLQYKYRGITELQMIAQEVSAFHKDICQVNEKSVSDPTKIEVHPLIFDKVIELKTKLKKLEKNGSFQTEKIIKSKIQEHQIKKKNLVNVQVPLPEVLLNLEREAYHQNHVEKLYRSFVAYYPESHSQPDLNVFLITFIEELYKLMKSRFFYLKQKEYFELEIEKLCTKLKKPKFLENKKRMLSGEINVKDVMYNKNNAFENLSAKKKDEEEMLKILKESEIRLDAGEAIFPEKEELESERVEFERFEENENQQEEESVIE